MEKFFKALGILVAVAGFAAVGVFAGEADAATQGTLGTSSTGSLNFSVTKPARADISNLSDLERTGWVQGDGTVILTEDVCIYSTRPNGGYTVLATGDGASEAFTLSNGTATVAYTVAWNGNGVGNLSNTGTSLLSNMVSSGFTNAATTSSSCSGTVPGPTARLIVCIPNSQMSSAPSGSYTGTLTLVITPN